MSLRIEWFSNAFLGLPYFLGALGEGEAAVYDQYPRYRVDAFDCDTYVNTVVALALSDSLHSFQQCIKDNRYANGKVDYLTRNHFASLDWNLNNQKRGIFQDITASIRSDHQDLTLMAQALIDKPNWYAHRPLSTIRLQQEDPSLQAQRLQELQTRGSKLTPATAAIPYLPLTALFSTKHCKGEHELKNCAQAKLELFAQIPHAAIIEIVRPNWDLRKEIGSRLNVSHMGFAIWKNQTLYFRQASSKMNKVADIPLIAYLQEALDSPTIKGINIQIVVPQKPSLKGC
jgi:hypothetical protein